MTIQNLSESATPFLAKFEIARFTSRLGTMIELAELYRSPFKSREKTESSKSYGRLKF